MRRYLEFLVIAIVFLSISALVRSLFNQDQTNDESQEFSGSLKSLSNQLGHNNNWLMVRQHSYVMSCESDVFCPSIVGSSSSIAIDQYSDDELAKELLNNLIAKYSSVNIKGAFHLNSQNYSFRCFDFILMNQDHHFGTTLAISSDKVVYTFTAINEPPGAYVQKKDQFIKILSDL